MYIGGWNLASDYGTEFRRSRKDRHSKFRSGRDTKQKERDWAERKIRRNLQRNFMTLYAATVFPFLEVLSNPRRFKMGEKNSPEIDMTFSVVEALAQ